MKKSRGFPRTSSGWRRERSIQESLLDILIVRDSVNHANVSQQGGPRGTIVLPAKLRRRLGIEEGSFVVAEEREDGILIRPATVLPVEIYKP